MTNGVKTVSLNVVSVPQDTQYRININGKINKYGIFSIKHTNITLQIKDRYNIVQIEEIIDVANADFFRFEKMYDSTELGVGPRDVVAIVNKVQFNNIACLIIAYIIMFASTAWCVVILRNKSKAK